MLSTHPAFLGQKEVVPLSGFSGALVALLRDSSGRSFVRKAAITPEASPRLRRQAERQVMLAKFLGGVACIPTIEREGFSADCYWFDMNFAAGRDGVFHLAEASHEEFEVFVRKIGKLVERFAATAVGGGAIALGQAMTAKFLEIDRKTGGRYRQLLARLSFASGAIGSSLRPTLSHGDMTLENLIVGKDHRLWLIDSIDSPFDHYWIDLSKLFQDCEGRWFRHRGRSLPLGLSWELRQRLFRMASNMDPQYPIYHYLLLAFTFARVLPYAKGEEDRSFLETRITMFTEACEDALEKGS